MFIKISIIYAADPLGPKIGGIETFVRGFIKYAPECFRIEFVGISSDRIKRPVKKWQQLIIGEKKFNFFPLFYEKDENKKTKIPLSLRFTLGLKFSPIDVSSRVLFFNRLEPAIVFKKAKSPKIGVIHWDIVKQLKKGDKEVYWNNFPWLYFKFENYIFKFLDIIYTVNNNTLEFYQSKYPKRKEKFIFLPNWVDTDIFFPINKPKDNIRQNLLFKNKQLSLTGKWILYVGRLKEVKAPFRLIKSFSKYYKTDKESQILIIGKGELEPKLKKYVAELGLERSAHFLGYKSPLELKEYYRASDILLLTSEYEAMPMCVLEALGCGLPVVTTNVGEVKKVVKNRYSGEVVESFSPEVISKFIKEVLNNPMVYSKDNCVKAIAEYQPKKVLKHVYEMIKQL